MRRIASSGTHSPIPKAPIPMTLHRGRPTCLSGTTTSAFKLALMVKLLTIWQECYLIFNFPPHPQTHSAQGEAMEMAEYLKKAGEVFKTIEDTLETLEEDVDYETADGKIEILFENGSSPIVVNTQRAIHEIWMAGGARAWHFKWDGTKNQWFAEAEQEEFYHLLAELMEERIHKPVVFE